MVAELEVMLSVVHLELDFDSSHYSSSSPFSFALFAGPFNLQIYREDLDHVRNLHKLVKTSEESNKKRLGISIKAQKRTKK